ncbi:hypothetical protein H650_07955 [Enterobacter sp. R4-368]|nr:hypothetical protein H650_07955 [Enterobacter sp. R4-368]
MDKRYRVYLLKILKFYSFSHCGQGGFFSQLNVDLIVCMLL